MTAALVSPGLVVVGMRGVGKSTVARLLGELLGAPWLDADAELERRAGRTIPELFREQGEAGFRQLERTVLLELLDQPGLILATGGGAVLHDEVRGRLKRRATLWLTAPVAVLAARVRHTDRPSLTGLPIHLELAEVLAQREPLYREVATWTMDTSRQSAAEVAQAAAALLRRT
ncbi:MAG: shikimate kinase [Deltaproteobacteria bacterium]|nr:shikimate kinase [Deltaproteobacteria bacterium]